MLSLRSVLLQHGAARSAASASRGGRRDREPLADVIAAKSKKSFHSSMDFDDYMRRVRESGGSPSDVAAEMEWIVAEMLEKRVRVRPGALVTLMRQLGIAESFRRGGQGYSQKVYAAESSLRKIQPDLADLPVWDLRSLTLTMIDLGNFPRAMDYLTMIVAKDNMETRFVETAVRGMARWCRNATRRFPRNNRPAGIERALGRAPFFVDRVVRTASEVNVPATPAMLSFALRICADCDHPRLMTKFLGMLRDMQGDVDDETWISAISAFSRAEEAQGMEKVIADIEARRDGVVPQEIVTIFLLRAARHERPPLARMEDVLERQVKAGAATAAHYGAMLVGYAMCGNLPKMEEMFQRYRSAGGEPSRSVASGLVRGYSLAGRTKCVQREIQAAVDAGVEINANDAAAAMSAALQKGDAAFTKSLYGLLRGNVYVRPVTASDRAGTSNVRGLRPFFLASYAAAMETKDSVFEGEVRKDCVELGGMRADRPVESFRLHALHFRGLDEEASALFNSFMADEHSVADKAEMMNMQLTGLFAKGDVEAVKAFWRSDVPRDDTAWNKYISWLCRNNDWKQAVAEAEAATSSGVKLNLGTYSDLIKDSPTPETRQEWNRKKLDAYPLQAREPNPIADSTLWEKQPVAKKLQTLDDQPKELPGGWVRYLDVERKQYYYHHESTGKTQWNLPPETESE